jgi:hypothetical protein
MTNRGKRLVVKIDGPFQVLADVMFTVLEPGEEKMPGQEE